jgi:hypothetical protein
MESRLNHHLKATLRTDGCWDPVDVAKAVAWPKSLKMPFHLYVKVFFSIKYTTIYTRSLCKIGEQLVSSWNPANKNNL